MEKMFPTICYLAHLEISKAYQIFIFGMEVMKSYMRALKIL